MNIHLQSSGKIDNDKATMNNDLQSSGEIDNDLHLSLANVCPSSPSRKDRQGFSEIDNLSISIIKLFALVPDL